VERRRQPEEEAASDAHDSGEEKHAEIDADLVEARNVARTEPHEEIRAPEREDHAQRAARSRQQEALGHELPRQTEASRPERGPDRHLLAAGGGAGEQEVGDVRRRDQKHERDRTERT
jgi:hypothetical protein